METYFSTIQISILQNIIKFLFIKKVTEKKKKVTRNISASWKAADKKHLVSLATNKCEKFQEIDNEVEWMV